MNVYLDGEFAFGLSRIVAAWLSVGQKLSDEKISEMQQQDEQEVALQKALVQLSYRPRTESEIQKKLESAGFDAETITAVMIRLREGGLVEDENFARSWIENRSSLRPRSQRYMAYELHQKGVQDEMVTRVLAEACSDVELADRAASGYIRRLDGMDQTEFRKKLSGFLARRGFSYGIIHSTVEKMWQQASADNQLTILNNEEN